MTAPDFYGAVGKDGYALTLGKSAAEVREFIDDLDFNREMPESAPFSVIPLFRAAGQPASRIRVGYVIITAEQGTKGGQPDILGQLVYADPYTALARARRFGSRDPKDRTPSVYEVTIAEPWTPPPRKVGL